MEQIEALLAEQAALKLPEAQAELLRACAFLAVTSIPGVTRKQFAAGAHKVLGCAENSAGNRWAESKAIWGEDFRFEG